MASISPPTAMTSFATPKPPNSLPTLGLFLGLLFISISPVAVKASPLSIYAMAFWRLVLPFPLFYAQTQYQKDFVSWKSLDTNSKKALIGCGMLFGINLLCYHIAIYYSSSTLAVLLDNLAPFFVIFYQIQFENQKISKQFIMASILALFGVVLLTISAPLSSALGWDTTVTFKGAPYPVKLSKDVENGSVPVVGVFAGLLAALSYAAYFLTVSHLRLKCKLSTLNVMYWSGTGILPTGIGVAIFHTHLVPWEFSGDLLIAAWVTLLVYCISVQYLGQNLISYSFGHLSAQYVSIVLLGQPVLASVFSWFLIAEPLSFFDLLGGLFVIFGLFMVIVYSKEESYDEIPLNIDGTENISPNEDIPTDEPTL